MKTTLLTLTLFLAGVSIAMAQVGIGTGSPNTTLEVVGNAGSATTPDGVQVPALTIAQLDAKVAAYGADQDAAIVFISDVSAGSTTTETAGITEKGFYYYDSADDAWKAVGGGGSSSSPTTYSIGDAAFGGIVFWVDETGQHGLVAATSDQSAGIPYWPTSANPISVLANRDGILAGAANTERTVLQTQRGSGYGAIICSSYQAGNYGDWYIPSKYELNLLYGQKSTVGGFSNENYWSSTDYNFQPSVWAQSFSDGSQSIQPYQFSQRLRCIRAF